MQIGPTGVLNMYLILKVWTVFASSLSLWNRMSIYGVYYGESDNNNNNPNKNS